MVPRPFLFLTFFFLLMATPREGFSNLKKSCNGGNGYNCFLIGYKYQKSGKLKSSRKYFLKACVFNEGKGCFNHGLILQKYIEKEKRKYHSRWKRNQNLKRSAEMALYCKNKKEGIDKLIKYCFRPYNMDFKRKTKKTSRCLGQIKKGNYPYIAKKKTCHLETFQLSEQIYNRAALRSYAKGCQLLHLDSCLNAGNLMRLQIGIKNYLIKAKDFYNNLCTLGNKSGAKGCYNIANLMRLNGLKGNFAPFYKKACGLGHSKSCLLITKLGQKLNSRKIQQVDSSQGLSSLIHNYDKKPNDIRKWLFVIGIENYEETDKVIYSLNSARAFEKTAKKVFGIPDENVYSIIGEKATSGKIQTALSRLLRKIEKKDTIYFYYSGHGVPSLKSGDAYILPRDLPPDIISSQPSLKLSNIYKSLNKSVAKKVIVFIDACFSGKTDGKIIFKGIAPGLIRTKEVRFNKNKMVIFKAGSSKQFSNSYDKKRHRLFSYFIIRNLLTTKRPNMKNFFEKIRSKVKRISWKEKGDSYLQEPQLEGNSRLGF